LIHSDRFAEHQTPPGHPERPERAEIFDVVADRWRQRGLDIVAPAEVHPGAVPGLLRYVLTGGGRLDVEGALRGHDLDRIEITCDRPLPMQADGEDLGDVEGAVFEAERNAVNVLV
jgi:diacylglycerol kinase family enzyme